MEISRKFIEKQIAGPYTPNYENFGKLFIKNAIKLIVRVRKPSKILGSPQKYYGL